MFAILHVCGLLASIDFVNLHDFMRSQFRKLKFHFKWSFNLNHGSERLIRFSASYQLVVSCKFMKLLILTRPQIPMWLFMELIVQQLHCLNNVARERALSSRRGMETLSKLRPKVRKSHDLHCFTTRNA